MNNNKLSQILNADLSQKLNPIALVLSLWLVAFISLFILSFWRIDYFQEHVENFSDDKITITLAIFIMILFGYGILFYVSSKKITKLGLILTVMIISLCVITPPFLSRDAGAYMLGAKNFSIYHSNPYLVGLNSVPSNTWSSELGEIWTLKYPFAYGPLFLFIASIATVPNFIHLISAVYLYKIIVLVAYLLSVYIFSKIAEKLLLKKYNVFLYALNPAILLNGLIEGHNEMFIVLFLLFSIYFINNDKFARSYFSWIAAVLVKYNVLIFLPVFWKSKSSYSFKKIILTLAGVAAVFVIVLALFFHLNIFLMANNFAIMKGQLQFCLYKCFPTSLIIDMLSGGYAGILRLITFSSVYFFILYKYLFKEDNKLKFIFWSSLSLIFILTRWISPWYVLIAIPIGILINEKNYRITVFLLTVFSLLHFFGVI
jgi:hypothetical protein